MRKQHEAMVELEQWISTEQAAELSDYRVEYVRQLCRQSRIEAQKIQRDWLISRESLLAYRRRMDRLGPVNFRP